MIHPRQIPLQVDQKCEHCAGWFKRPVNKRSRTLCLKCQELLDGMEYQRADTVDATEEDDRFDDLPF